jgi:hypothetical protein
MANKTQTKAVDLYSHCQYVPGCRTLTVEVYKNERLVNIRLSIEAGLLLATEILQMHDLAWSDGSPQDLVKGEKKPNWVMRKFRRKYLRREFR